jgi:hypothetical protein
MNTNERPFFVSKDILDTVNSVSWFLMDASWMLQVKELSMAMIVPTILTGIFLCYIEKRKNITFINFAILSWICMNVCWMFSELFDSATYLITAKSLFGLGVVFILIAISKSDSIADTFSHFRRFRIMKR